MKFEHCLCFLCDLSEKDCFRKSWRQSRLNWEVERHFVSYKGSFFVTREDFDIKFSTEAV